MTDESVPDWVKQTLSKFVVPRNAEDALPAIGRNMQAEINRLQSVIDVVSNNKISKPELARLRKKTQDLLNILSVKP